MKKQPTIQVAIIKTITNVCHEIINKIRRNETKQLTWFTEAEKSSKRNLRGYRDDDTIKK